MKLTAEEGVVALTQRLVAFDTVNPPGTEAPLAIALAEILEAAGGRVCLAPFAADRQSLIATFGGQADRPLLAFTGHLDTVPLGGRPWEYDPFAGEVAGNRLYGRGATDMKGGIAAFIVATLRFAARLEGTPGVRLILTAAEETGCEGARELVADGLPLGPVGALIVGEPTSNVPLVGHKGCLWLRAVVGGVAAHGSMPHLGVNAVCRAARIVRHLEGFDISTPPHPLLGQPTLNIGYLQGGTNINTVPDRAEIGIDIRTTPALDHAVLAARLASEVGEGIELETLVDTPGIWTDPAEPWVQEVFAVAKAVTGNTPSVGGAPFVTDASLLTPALGGVPTVILGPGEIELAHQTDEYCRVDRLEQAVAIYEQLICRWCRL